MLLLAKVDLFYSLKLGAATRSLIRRLTGDYSALVQVHQAVLLYFFVSGMINTEIQICMNDI